MKVVVIFTLLCVLTVNALAQDTSFPQDLQSAKPGSRSPDIKKIWTHLKNKLCQTRQLEEYAYLHNRRINWGNVVKSVGKAVATGIAAYHQYSRGRSGQLNDAEADRLAFADPLLQTRRINWGHVITSVGHALMKGIEAYHLGISGQLSDAEAGDRLLLAQEVGKHVLGNALEDPEAIEYLHHGLDDDGYLSLLPLRANNYGWTPPGRPPPYRPTTHPA